MEILTATDAIKILADRAQWCRENGESDMRNILNTCRGIQSCINAGMSRDEIISVYAIDDDDEATP